MALSDEQNAMLRLLASGEQGYGDIAALLGLSEAEVRARVVGALAQLQAEGKPAPDIPPPLPGGARPAAEVTPPEPEPVAEAPAAEAPAEPAIADAVAPAAPAAESAPPTRDPGAGRPKAAPAAPKAATAAGSAAPPRSQGRTVTLPAGRRAWVFGGTVIGVIVVVVAIVLLSSGGGGDSSSTSATESAANTPAEGGATGESAAETKGAAKPATEAELSAVDGSKAAGRAAFGRVKNKLALQVEATGLAPNTKGTDSYWIWLAQSPTKMLPLASTEVKASGKGAGTIAAEYEVPVEVLGYLANGTFDQISITRADNAKLQASIKTAEKEETTPAYTGEAVLNGTITGPIVGLAGREKAAGEEEKGK